MRAIHRRCTYLTTTRSLVALKGVARGAALQATWLEICTPWQLITTIQMGFIQVAMLEHWFCEVVPVIVMTQKDICVACSALMTLFLTLRTTNVLLRRMVRGVFV